MKTPIAISLLACMSFCTGCASLTTTKQINRGAKAKEAPQNYAQRKEEAVRAFERQRDAAQVQAAINGWQRGDVQKSMSTLTKILERNPRDANARLRLAEMLTAQENFAAAEKELRECVVHAPDSAEAHHSLGMLLSEFAGRESEAQTHLRRAAELDPRNELYVASAK